MSAFKVPFLRTAFNYDRNLAGDESGLDCSVEPSMTQQSFAAECDINTIVRMFGVTGELPSGVRMPTYGDFSGVFDFHSAVNAISAARESFDQMPAEVRYRFHNDPAEFVDFCSAEANRDEAIKLGLVLPRAVALAAAPVEAAAPGTPAPAAAGGS
ncbi:MAG: internal scaffolding protein [Microvirus sp.]|nr:MAG: internal scaffolding protein [Microvirus sp.]